MWASNLALPWHLLLLLQLVSEGLALRELIYSTRITYIDDACTSVQLSSYFLYAFKRCVCSSGYELRTYDLCILYSKELLIYLIIFDFVTSKVYSMYAYWFKFTWLSEARRVVCGPLVKPQDWNIRLDRICFKHI